MTGIEALQALLEGKKVTNLEMKGHYYACVIKYTIEGSLLTKIAWVEACVTDDELDWVWQFSDPFNVSDFLQDDWEVVE